MKNKDPAFLQLVLNEQHKSLYEKTTSGFIITVLAGSLLLLVPDSEVSKFTLFTWYASFFFCAFLRPLAAYCCRLNTSTRSPSNLIFWNRIYAGSVFTTGLAWTALLFILKPPVSPEYVYLTKVYVMGITITALIYFYAYPPAMLAMNIPVMMGFFYLHISNPTPSNIILSVLVVLYSYVLFISTRRAYLQFLSGQELRANLLKEKDKAEKATAAKTEFLATASHDLREPLNSLAIFVALLDQKIDKKSSKRIIVDNICSSVDSFKELLNGLLDLSKLESKSVVVKPIDFHLMEVLQPLIRDFDLEAKHKNINLVCNATDMIIHSDVMLITRILRNILSNAVKNTYQGNVSIDTFREGNTVRLAISDTGIGIPKEKLGEVFDKYLQLNNYEEKKFHGLGLGLTIVKKIATMLDHPIALTSNEGEGTRFFIDIPLGKSNSLHTANDGVSLDTHLQLNIIIITSEQKSQTASSLLLKSWGCNVKTYHYNDIISHRQELEALQPNAIFIDWQNYDPDGTEILKCLLAVYDDNVARLLLLPYAGSQINTDTLKHDFHCLLKPIDVNELNRWLVSIQKKSSPKKTEAL